MELVNQINKIFYAIGKILENFMIFYDRVKFYDFMPSKTYETCLKGSEYYYTSYFFMIVN